MITIENNQDGKQVMTKVSKGAYESFYKRLGYSIVEDKAREVDKKDPPKPITKNNELENFTIEESLENKEEKKTSKRKTISNE